MNGGKKRIVIFAASLVAVVLVWAADDSRIDVANAAAPDSELYAQQLADKLSEFDLRADQIRRPGVDATQAQSREEAQLALIIFSEGISACAASGCAASACAGSACGGSGCAASGCGGSGCVGSGCAGSACAGSACGGSLCGGSACGASACAGSGCGGSGCIGSGCVGSGCVKSGCVGSACVGTGCVGSACQHCSYLQPDEAKRLAALDGRIIAFNVDHQSAHVDISWIVTGTDVSGYRLYRVGIDGRKRTLVAAGQAEENRLMSVTDASPPSDARYEVEVIDITGRVIRTGVNVLDQPLASIPAPEDRPS